MVNNNNNYLIFCSHFCFIDVNKIDALVKRADSLLDEKELRKMFHMMAQPASGMIEKMPESTPRFIKTHVPMSFLNPNLLETAKMVYVARDPRDVVVSCYHHAKLFKLYDLQGPFKDFWTLFYKHLCMYRFDLTNYPCNNEIMVKFYYFYW